LGIGEWEDKEDKGDDLGDKEDKGDDLGDDLEDKEESFPLASPDP